MLEIDGYSDFEEIYRGMRTVLYRGSSTTDGTSYIFKAPSSAIPPQRVISALKHEYRVLRKFDSPKVIRAHALQRTGNSVVLILEDFGGIPLQAWHRQITSSQPEILQVAIRIAEALQIIHRQQIIHKDINPTNVLINPHTHELKISDFDIASMLNRENQNDVSPATLEGTMAYLSPEQTGRMNRAIDYRTDFYALGILLYEMLTGTLPFLSDDPLEMVHFHIARIPAAPSERNPQIPLPVSDIVMKLMAKTPEERYQSTFGIISDLQACCDQLEQNGRIENLVIGGNDLNEVFTIPQKLYGRQEELHTLLSAFQKASSGVSGMVLIGGYAGIGKTTLVQEIYKPVTALKGYFVSGKYNQIRRNIPYEPILEAFAELIRQILTESKERLAQWKLQLQEALGANARVLADVMPEIEHVLGSTPPVPALPPLESQNRFNRVFLDALQVFARKEHPLVLFLDDLQWVDSASLQLIKLMMTNPESGHLLLIAAYRDNMVDDQHPFQHAITEMFDEGTKINTIKLKTLPLDSVAQLIADAFHCPAPIAESLAEIIYKKTDGNPFFSIQLLNTLHTKGLVEFVQGSGASAQRGGWRWDLDQIRALDVSDNVVDLMTAKMQTLPEKSREVLKLAACIGNVFGLATLSVVQEVSGERLSEALQAAINAQLLLPLDVPYYHQDEAPAESHQLSDELYGVPIRYKFTHDRVQQAAYSLIPPAQKKQMHLKIGRLLRDNIDQSHLDENAFTIINHLNHAMDLITDDAERIACSYMNLSAAFRAQLSAAFEQARHYFIQGRDFLGENAWADHYDLAWAIYSGLGETTYISGDFDEAEAVFDQLISHSRTNVEKARIYATKVILYTHLNKVGEALDLGIQGLKLLDYHVPAAPGKFDLGKMFVRVRLKLRKYEIDDLDKLPEMSNALALAALELIIPSLTAAYFHSMEMIGYLNLMMMDISLAYGRSVYTPYVYCQYAILLGAGLADYETAYALGKLSLDMSYESDLPHMKSKTNLGMGSTVNHWQQPAETNFRYLEECYRFSLEAGDLLFSIYANRFLIITRTFCGHSLQEIHQDSRQYLEYARRLKIDEVSVLVYLSFINIMLGNAPLPSKADDTLFERREDFDNMLATRDTASLMTHQIHKLAAFYLFDNPQAAFEVMLASEKSAHGALGQLTDVEYRMYSALTLAVLIRDSSASQQKPYRKKLAGHLKKLEKWATACPVNFRPHYLLVKAELKWDSSHRSDPESDFEAAINAAREVGFIHLQAIASERLGRYYVESGRARLASVFLSDAHAAYVQWGATGKALHLKEALGSHFIAAPELRAGDADDTAKPGSTASKLLETLDTSTILKASQALFEEIELSKLLAKMLKIVIENAAAERGLFFWQENDEFVLEGEGRANSKDVQTLQGIPLDQFDQVPASLIRLVYRTEKAVVLANAAAEGKFINDPFVVENQTKSILCLPVMYQNQNAGILYLENNLTTGAFTPERIAILKILSSEIAIAIQNARLYSRLQTANTKLEEVNRTLEEKVRERTQGLQESNNKLTEALDNLTRAQVQLVQSEKMASLGELTAGIAHEIKNPLNFVINFSELNLETVKDLEEALGKIGELQSPDDAGEVRILLAEILDNSNKICSHGQRADSIVKSMMRHARGVSDEKRPVNINQLLEEYRNLAFHGLRAKNPEYTIHFETDYDEDIPEITLVPQNLGRALLNIIHNACYAASEAAGENKANGENPEREPTVRLTTKRLERAIEIRIRDNGAGIPEHIRERIFNPFFTTKPTGQGTGLGLSIAYDVVVQENRGEILVETTPGQFTELIIRLPIE